MNTLRLISPTHRRIVELNPTNKIDALTDVQLRALGWIDYLGPGMADARGWFIEESDRSIDPPLRTRPVKMPGQK